MELEQHIPDRRKTGRVGLGNLVAYVDLHDGSSPVMVCMWDISLGGACLMVPPDITIPDEFDLIIDGLSNPVTVIWHRWSHLGVSFNAPPQYTGLMV